MDLRELKGWASAVALKGQQLARTGFEFVGRRGSGLDVYGEGRNPECNNSTTFLEAPLTPNFAQYWIQESDQRTIPPLKHQEDSSPQSCVTQKGVFASECFRNSKSSDICCLELPVGLVPSALTVENLRALLDLPAVFHLRFKVRCLYTLEGAVWVDEPSPSSLVPLFDGRILFKLLLLPVSEEQRQTHRENLMVRGVDAAKLLATLSPESPLKKEQIYLRADEEQCQSGEDSSSLPVASGAPPEFSFEEEVSETPEVRLKNSRVESDDLLDFLVEAEANAPWCKDGSSKTDKSPTRAASLNRSHLAASRESLKQQRIQKKIQEVEDRRALEAKQQQERLSISVYGRTDAVRLELHKWAKTPDGKFKDTRMLLSTIEEVLWEGADWNAVSVSTLMIPQHFKRHFRKALLLTHPDKHQGASAEQQFRAESAFHALSESYKTLQR